MTTRNNGFILNVASSAGLLKGGPLMSTYYATKSYVTSFTGAIYEELRRNKSSSSSIEKERERSRSRDFENDDF